MITTHVSVAGQTPQHEVRKILIGILLAVTVGC